MAQTNERMLFRNAECTEKRRRNDSVKVGNGPINRWTNRPTDRPSGRPSRTLPVSSVLSGDSAYKVGMAGVQLQRMIHVGPLHPDRIITWTHKCHHAWIQVQHLRWPSMTSPSSFSFPPTFASMATFPCGPGLAGTRNSILDFTGAISYSFSLVSSGIGDCLWAGKLSDCLTSHPGQLSLSSLRGR